MRWDCSKNIGKSGYTIRRWNEFPRRHLPDGKRQRLDLELVAPPSLTNTCRSSPWRGRGWRVRRACSCVCPLAAPPTRRLLWRKRDILTADRFTSAACRRPRRYRRSLDRCCDSTLYGMLIRTFGPRLPPGPGGIPASAWGQASAPISRPTLCEQWWLLNVNVSSARSGCGAVGTRRRGRLARGAPRPARRARRGRHLTREPCPRSRACPRCRAARCATPDGQLHS